MEFEQKFVNVDINELHRLHRTTVEFEPSLLGSARFSAFCLHRTTVEFELLLLKELDTPNQVCIEPRWNLNGISRGAVGAGAAVCIEPRWNLNYALSTPDSTSTAVCIEPRWNLNWLKFYYPQVFNQCLHRTTVEFEPGSAYAFGVSSRGLHRTTVEFELAQNLAV